MIAVEGATCTLPDSCPFTYALRASPTVSSLSPTSGTAGTVVSISGTGFGGVGQVSVSLGSHPCNVTTAAESLITCVVAAGTAMVDHTVSVLVSSIGRTLTNHSLAFHHQRSIWAISPTFGSTAGGTHLTIRGDGFSGRVADVAVSIGGAPCIVASAAADEISCVTGAAPITLDPPTWAHQVVVSIGAEVGACDASAGCTFTYSTAFTPTVTSMTSTPLADGRFELRVQGSGFAERATANSLSIGGAPCAVIANLSTSASAGQLQCTTVAISAGVHRLRLWTEWGLAVGVPSMPTLRPPLSVDAPYLVNSSMAGGRLVTLLGSGFGETVEANAVSVCGLAAEVTDAGATSLSFRTPSLLDHHRDDLVTSELPMAGRSVVQLAARSTSVSAVPPTHLELAEGVVAAFHFNLSSVPRGATVVSALLRLHGARGSGALSLAVSSAHGGCGLAAGPTTTLHPLLGVPAVPGNETIQWQPADWTVHMAQEESPPLQVLVQAAADARQSADDPCTILIVIEPRGEGSRLVACADEGCAFAPTLALSYRRPTTADQLQWAPPELCDVRLAVAPLAAAGDWSSVADADGSAEDAASDDDGTIDAGDGSGRSCGIMRIEPNRVWSPGAACTATEVSITSGTSDDARFVVDGVVVLGQEASGSAAGLCAVQLDALSREVVTTRCFATHEAVSQAIAFASWIDLVASGDIVLVASRGASLADVSLSSAFAAAMHALGADYSGTSGSAPQGKYGTYGYVLVGVKDRDAWKEERSTSSRATLTVAIPCRSPPQPMAPFFGGWGEQSHVAALLEHALAAPNASPAAKAADGVPGSFWLAIGSNATLTADLGQLVAMHSLTLHFHHPGSDVLVLVSSAARGEAGWRVGVSTQGADDATGEDGALTLTFQGAPLARRLRIVLAAPTDSVEGRQVLAVSELVVSGCEAAEAVTLTHMVSFAAEHTPVVHSISPQRGSTAGGTELEIHGSGFNASGLADVGVRIAGVPCTPTFAHGSVVRCRTGAHGPTNASYPGRGVVRLTVAAWGEAATTDDSIFHYVDLWSSPSTWGGAQPPRLGDSVVIPSGQSVLLDVSPPRLYALIIQGHLSFDRVDLALNASTIFVQGGSLQVGTEAEPFLQQATITLHGNPASRELPIYGAKVLGCRACTLDLHGRPVARTWTRLAATAAAGSTELWLVDPVDDWYPGGGRLDVGGAYGLRELRVVVTSTSVEMEEAEELVVSEVRAYGHQIILSRPTKHVHLGETHFYGGQPVEMRAEVALLSRNVIVQGDDESVAPALYGATIMMHSSGHESLVSRIEHIEVRRAGQAFRLGRYPVHCACGTDQNPRPSRAGSVDLCDRSALRAAAAKSHPFGISF